MHFCLFNDPSPPYIYPLSLHDALPISDPQRLFVSHALSNSAERTIHDAGSIRHGSCGGTLHKIFPAGDRKSTRLNSSHRCISYAVFCLKKKMKLIFQTLSYVFVYAIST